MCGIFFACSTNRNIEPDAELLAVLRQRGPDSTTVLTYRTSRPQTTKNSHEQVFLTLASTVLSLRGDTVVKQPYHEHEDGSILCWNGEAWHVAGERVTGSDTQQVFALLQGPRTDGTLKTHLDDLAKRLSTVSGPYAFVFFDHAADHVYFGRDFLGRRSLLYQITSCGSLLISSVSTGGANGPWSEIEADGVYCIDFGQRTESVSTSPWGSFVVKKQPYHIRDPALQSPQSSVLPSLTLNKETRRGRETDTTLTMDGTIVTLLHQHLSDSLRTRVLGIPDPPVMSINSTTIASTLAILFSGGLDCTLLARITHDLLPREAPIDLINVAFENPRIHKNVAQDGPSAYELCPDRITGRASFKELLEICPERPWLFIAVNVPYSEFQEHRSTVVSLIHPHNTEMDLSISCALYFAARGSGLLSNSREQDCSPYTTTARVLLSGLGADELFAGYTRHYTTYQRGGLPALWSELELDIRRLSKRNLGRDDRVTSNWSKEVRHPYLDEAFVQWALNCPIFEKCGFGETTGHDTDESAGLIPDKKVLRCLAWKLGMKNAAKEKKRAIQFGARTAKMETNKTKGTTLLL